MATMILSDYGAEVIKIERPGVGDETRSWGPPFVGSEKNKESAYFLCLNRNKRSVTVNIKDPKGQEIMHKLAVQSDVFIANFPAGKLKKCHLGWDDLHAINDKLVYVSITGYGEAGPYANRPAYDLIMEGESGLTDLITNLAGSSKPLTAGLPVSDIFTALYAHGAVMAGLLARQQTGKGIFLETSLFSSQLSALTNYASNVLLSPSTNGLTNPKSSHHPTLTPYQPFPAQDNRFFNIAANNQAQFKALCQVFGHSEWAEDARFSSNEQRTANRAALVELISAETVKQPSNVWIEKLNAAGVPCGNINTIREALEHPQIEPCQMIRELDHNTLGSIKLIGPAVRVRDGPSPALTAPPTLGQHTEQVLSQLYSQEELANFRKRGIV